MEYDKDSKAVNLSGYSKANNTSNILADKKEGSNAISAGKVNTTAPIKLVSGSVGSSATKNALSSIRNGPIKAGVGVAGHQTKTTSVKQTNQVQPPRNNANDSQNSLKQQKTSEQPAKKQRPATAQHSRPSSPGIHGKVADAPYKSYANTLKSNTAKYYE